jgi:hypothetical protein
MDDKDKNDPIFDIDEFMSMYVGSDRKFYLEKIKNSTDEELKSFYKLVIRHRKGQQRHRYTPDIILPQGRFPFSIHNDFLLKAIKWEQCRRSPSCMWIYRITLPFKRWWWGLWLAADLEEEEYFGATKIYRKGGRTDLEYLGLRKLAIDFLFSILYYLNRNHKWIIGTIVAISAILVRIYIIDKK